MMDVRGRESNFVLGLRSLSCFLLVLGLYIHEFALFVHADDDKNKSQEDDSKERKADEEEDRELCEEQCDYGCCEHLQCCPPPTDLPRFSVQAVAVVGACVVTFMLLCLCVMRYRMTAKITRNNSPGHAETGRSNASTATGGCSSVCSGVPGPQSRICSWNPLRTLILLEESRLGSSGRQTPAELIMAPPPYSECVLQGSAVETLPPSYEEVVKASQEHVTAPETSTSSSTSSSPASASSSASSPASVPTRAEQTSD